VDINILWLELRAKNVRYIENIAGSAEFWIFLDITGFGTAKKPLLHSRYHNIQVYAYIFWISQSFRQG
jgi:hypothetical protein